MALSSNLISFIFFTTLLLPLHQINARESQFFSKVTNVNNNKEDPVNKPEQQQQPAFIPETENSYGLYGHDESNIPFTKTTPTTNYQSYKTTTEFEDTSKYNNNNNKYFNYDNNDNAYYNTNNQNEFSNTRVTGTGYYNNNYNGDSFGKGYQNELSDTKYTEGSGYNSMENQNNNNQKYYNNNNERYTYNNNNNAAKGNYFYSNNNNNNDAANNSYNGERQGMSDTRFMEDGKYFYDTSSRFDRPPHGDAYRGLSNENWYTNNNNNYDHGNNNEYQNQENFEDEP